MLELLQAGGWLMVPIVLCSIVAMVIVIERFWALRRRVLMPDGLISEVLELHRRGVLDERHVHRIRDSSALGRILAAGLTNRFHSREIMKEAIEDAGRQVVAWMERRLNTLGTIAAVTPLLGLLGTVLGMIDVFAVIMDAGVGNPGVLAGGISKALITTAAGLSVAIPTLIFYRHFVSRVGKLILAMEEQALRLLEALAGQRELDDEAPV